MPLTPFADAEAIAIKHLRTDQTLAQARVHGEIPTAPVWPLITLHRSGGLAIQKHVLDRPTLQVEAWADSKAEARYVAAQAQASLKRLEGQKVSVLLDGTIEVGGHVTNVEEVQGLLWLPDPDTGRARYLFQVALTIRA